MDENNKFIKEEVTEVVQSFHESEGQTNNTVNVEQNINVISIDMGKQSLNDRFNLEGKKEWIKEHMPLVIAGGILVFYTAILAVMGVTISKYKGLMASIQKSEANTDVVEEVSEPLEEPVI